MVRGDQMPRQPQKSLSLDTFVKKPEPQRGIEASDSADESLFGKFVKARHLDLVDEVEVPSRPAREFHRSASASKLVKTKPKRRPSPATTDSAPPSRPSSMRSMTLRSESPGPPPSPDPPRPQSLRSMKSRSRSPSVQKKDLILSSVPPSPRVATQHKLPKSPKGQHPRGHSKGKSPKSPKKGAKADLLKQGLAPILPLDDSSHPPPPPPPSTDDDNDIVANTPTTTNLNKSNHDDLPTLVDDSLIREQLAGQRGTTHWNIMEDTPAGHAEEKLTLVSAVENDDQSSDWRTDPSDDIEEDDDIIDDDADEHSLVVARFRRRNSLPTDPSASYPSSSQSQRETAVRNDRFAPGFNNHEMWSDGATLDTQLPPVRRSLSVDASLLSDDWMSLGDTTDSIVPEPPGELRGRRSDLINISSGIPLPNYNTETPSTIKQTGRSPMQKQMELIPSLDTDSSSKDTSTNGLSRLPIAHKVVNNSSGKNPGRKPSEPPTKKDHSSSEPKGSTSTGRSSDRRTTQKPRKERDALRGRKPPKIPEVIPAAQEVDVRSPSTLTSTQISVLSSSRSRQQGQGLQALRQRHTPKQSPKQYQSRPLNLHVESGNDRALAMQQQQQHDDDYTIGASTITTNFSTTQRTMSDKTVSIRSLFQSNATSPSQVPRLPQRCDEEGDFEDLNDEPPPQQQQPPQPPKRSAEDDDITNSTHLPDAEITIEDLFNGKVSLKKPLGISDEFPSVLRRPSGDAEDGLGMMDSHHSTKGNNHDTDDKDGSDHAEDLSLEDSGAFNNSPSQKQRPRSTLSLLNKLPKSPRSPDPKFKKPSSFHRLSGGSTSLEPPPERISRSNSTRESNGSGGRSSSPHTATNPQPPVPPKDSTTKASERIYDGVGHSSGSPSENSKKIKRRTKLGLFKRVASWKAAVPLEDDDA